MYPRKALAYARAHRPEFLAALGAFLRIPSISAQPRHAPDVRRCAEWLAGHLGGIGMDRARVVPTRGHPLVLAEWRKAPGRPTVLIYGHYDVQPVDPLTAWRRPPFRPRVRGENLYARGASDDKGPILAHLAALEAMLRGGGRLPVNVVCLFEGEEEVGSPNLRPYLERHGRSLGADVAVISDTRMLGPDRPALITGLRGHVTLELTVHGPSRDLHAGNFGGAVHNPIQALAEIVARLHTPEGRVAVPGFYDGLGGPPPRPVADRRGPPDAKILREAGVARGWGEPGYSAHERTTARPALTFNGVVGGYTGAGPKSIIPASATVKLGVRLVPGQDPSRIERLLRRRIAALTPPTVRTEVRAGLAVPAVAIPTGHAAVRAAAEAYRRGFGRAPAFLRSGGTIGPVAELVALGIPTVLMGFSLPDDRNHAPNEKFHLPTFFRAIDSCLWFFAELASRQVSRPRRVTREGGLGRDGVGGGRPGPVGTAVQ